MAKIPFLLLLLAILSTSTFPQKKIGQKKPSASTTYSRKPFDPQVVVLQKQFLGNSLKDLWSYLSVMGIQAKCDKFEKTDACKERIERMKILPLDPYGAIHAGDQLAFAFKARCDYNADKEKFYCDLGIPIQPKGDYAYVWSEESSTNSYVGQNAFGVKRQITRVFTERWVLNPPQRIYPITLANMQPAAAEKIAPNIRLLLIGTVKSPYGETFKSTPVEPTISSPIRLEYLDHVVSFLPSQMWAYNFVTGEVLGSVSLNSK